jgi:nucleoside-diphosphate-sugar epimerase
MVLSSTVVALFLCVAPSCALRVTVVGGTGFVGSRVCKSLVDKGAEVTSVSKSGRVPAWAAGEAWTRDVRWASVDLLSGDEAATDAAIGSPDSVVSCVGVVDPDPEVLRRGNGDANVNAFASAKRGGVKRAVYVSVASEVVACEENWLPFAQAEFRHDGLASDDLRASADWLRSL